MKLSDSLIHLKLPDDYRLIVISDVHANAPGVKRVLQKASYHEEKDVLIFLGDLFERKPYFEETISFIRSLIGKKNIYFIRGNWERFVFSLSYEQFDHFYDKERTLFTYWINKEGLGPITKGNFEDIKHILYQTHQEFLDWTFS